MQQCPLNIVLHTEGPRLTLILGPEIKSCEAKSQYWRTLGLHYVKTLKNPAGARNRTNYSVDANVLVHKPKPRWSEICAR